MPRRQSSNTSASEVDVATEQIIFSCGICQATVSDLYAEKDKVQGLSSSDGESGIVPKLWIAECAHVFCGKHLEGGGAPFHSKNDGPKARCPVCVSEQKRDHEERRNLFPIRGLGQGEYDEAIPDGYMQVPPVKLDSNDSDMDALRFQYGHLVRYAKAVTQSWKTAEKKRRTMEHTLSRERKQWRKQEAELNERVAGVDKTEAKLKKWEGRKDMINHYLGLVTKMSDDMNAMEHQLLELGYEVPQTNYGYEESKQAQQVPHEQTSQTNKKKDSSATLVASSSSRKRKHPTRHGDYADEDFFHDKENHNHQQRREWREMMPPPLPKARSSQQPPLPVHRQERLPERSQQAIQVYEDEQWHGGCPDVVMQDHSERMQPLPQHSAHHKHGALPIRTVRADVYQSQPHHRPMEDYDERCEGQPMPMMNSQPASAQRSGLMVAPPRRRSQQCLHEGSELEHGQPDIRQQEPPPGFSNFGDHNDTIEYPGSFYNTPVSQSRPMGPPPPLGTPSMRRPFGRVPAPTSSPFFANCSVMQRPDTIQRPPARGSLMHNAKAPPSRQETMGRQYGSLPRASTQSSFPGMSRPPSQSFGSQEPAGSGMAQSQHRYAVPSYRQPQLLRSQEHSTSNGAFQFPGMSQQHAQSQPMSDAQPGRLTLPPGRSRRAFLGSQDTRLAMIPGVRGATASQSLYSRQSLASAHNASRYLSSGRRPVQR